MALTCTADNRSLTVSLSGEIDQHAARILMLDLEREVAHYFPETLTLDLRQVTFMDSSGIALILRTWRRLQETGGTLRVVNVPRQAAKVLRAAGVQRMVYMTFLD